MMRTIAHIVNPVIVGQDVDLFYAQPVTFETMRAAQEFAAGRVDVQLFSAQYAEDRAMAPDFMQKTPDLERSVLDVGTFTQKRKLPLIKDILDRLYQASDAEYFIYTNVDIGLMPHFYLAVDQLIESGCDAFLIRRRTLTKEFTRIEELPMLFSQIGWHHPGHDCFVFRRDLYPAFVLGTLCIGVLKFGRALAVNLMYNAKNFHLFEDLHLTFHIGNDRVFRPRDYEYIYFNERELLKVLLHYNIFQHPVDHPIISALIRTYTRRSIIEKLQFRWRRFLDKSKSAVHAFKRA